MPFKASGKSHNANAIATLTPLAFKKNFKPSDISKPALSAPCSLIFPPSAARFF